MNIRNAVREFLRGETRQSRRLEAVRFVRRYSDGTRPVTHYRLHGASVEAVPALLKAAGLKEAEDFSVMTSDHDPSIAKLVWLEGGNGGEFASACALQGLDVLQHGLTACDSAYAAILRKETDDAIAACFAEGGTDVAEEDGGVEDFVPLATMASNITTNIVKSVREYLADPSNYGSLSPNEISMYEPLRSATADAGQVNFRFIPPLFVLEFYVRRVLGLADSIAGEGGPADSIFAPYTGGHAYVRPIVRRGEPAVLPHLLDAPLFELVECNECGDDMMAGYISNYRQHVEAKPKCKALAVIGNSQLMLDYGPCPDKVAAADYVMNHRYDFWKYLRRIYASAFGPVVNAELMSISRIGIRNNSAMFAHHCASIDDSEPMVSHLNRIRPDLNALVMYGVVLSYERMGQPCVSEDCLPGAGIGIESQAPVPPEFALTRLTKEEFPAEWFVLTHCDGTEFADSLSAVDKAGREDTFTGFFRPFVKERLTAAEMQKWCRGDNPSFVPANTRDGSTVFHAMSSLVSCVVAAIKDLHTFQEGATFVHRKGLAKGDALRDAVVAGVFSGVSTDLAPEDCDATQGVFPKIKSDVIYAEDPFEDLPQLEGKADRFTAFMNALHADPTLQLRMAPRSAGKTRCYHLVIETNLTADVLTNASDEEREAFQERMRRIATWSLALRYADPFRVLSGNSITDPMSNVGKARSALSLDDVKIDQAFKGARCYRTPFDARAFIVNYVHVGWRADVANRLHIMLELRGDGAQLARTVWRSLAGLPAANAELAQAAWTPTNDSMTVYAPNRSDADTAAELVRKGLDVLGAWTEFNHALIPFGGFVPMVGPAMSVVEYDTYPGRPWFMANGANSFDPCANVRIGCQ